MIKYALIQFPQKESLSGKIFNKYFDDLDLQSTYDDLEINPDNFDRIFPELLTKYEGLNITIPFKEKVLKFVECDEDVQTIGAANCIYKGKGYNTDWKGFYKSLKNEDLSGSIFILGAGGSSKAVIYALYKLGVKEVTVCNRTKERAESLKQQYEGKINVNIIDYSEKEKDMKNHSIFINTTSIGMMDEKHDFDLNILSGFKLIYEVIYNDTDLKKFAKEKKIKCIDGKTMWYYQALENLKIWGILKIEN